MINQLLSSCFLFLSEEYEKEINETTKQFNKDQIEIERLKLDIVFKTDETKKLQNDLNDFAEAKKRCNQLEEKLNLEVRNSQYLQNKILQLEQEMMNLTRNSTKQNDSERLVDNLKEMIREQINTKTTAIIDIEEYKLKVCVRLTTLTGIINDFLYRFMNCK